MTAPRSRKVTLEDVLREFEAVIRCEQAAGDLELDPSRWTTAVKKRRAAVKKFVAQEKAKRKKP